MLRIFFCANYWLVTKIFKNESYPFIATIISMSAYMFFSILFVVDFCLFQILKRRDLLMERDETLGFVFITIILFANYFFYKKKYNTYLKKFEKSEKTKQNLYKTITVLYMMGILFLTVCSLYLVRNNIYWY
jgi:hypothetical protein